MNMKWTVEFSGKASKQRQKLSQCIADILAALVADIEDLGPVRGDWPNYSKLSG
jgi:mRNA-degrading endonuclease RelE of RelBE toxin-antitoxin system